MGSNNTSGVGRFYSVLYEKKSMIEFNKSQRQSCSLKNCSLTWNIELKNYRTHTVWRCWLVCMCLCELELALSAFPVHATEFNFQVQKPNFRSWLSADLYTLYYYAVVSFSLSPQLVSSLLWKLPICSCCVENGRVCVSWIVHKRLLRHRAPYGDGCNGRSSNGSNSRDNFFSLFLFWLFFLFECLPGLRFLDSLVKTAWRGHF